MRMKYFVILLTCFSLIALSSCKKRKLGPYGKKIVGTWTCDSIVEFKPNNNDSLVYYNTDHVPKTYVFKKVKGVNLYKWNDDLVEMNEDEGYLNKEGNFGDIGNAWYITSIDEHQCVLKLDYRGGLGSYVTSRYWYYLRR